MTTQPVFAYETDSAIAALTVMSMFGHRLEVDGCFQTAPVRGDLFGEILEAADLVSKFAQFDGRLSPSATLNDQLVQLATNHVPPREQITDLGMLLRASDHAR